MFCFWHSNKSEKATSMRSKISKRLKFLSQAKNYSINLPVSNKPVSLSTIVFQIFIILSPTLSVLSLLYISDWSLFRLAGIRGSDFMDYQTILSYRQCLKETNLFEFPPHFSECWAGFNYGFSAILLVGGLNYFLGSVAAVGWTTIFLVVISLVSLSFYSGAHDFKGRIFQSLLIVSPGMLLLYERGNLDSWIYIFSIILVLAHKHVSPFLLFICLFLVTMIKFHTLLASLYLISRLPISKNYKVFMLISISLATGISLAPMVSLIPYNWFISFGSFMPFIYLDFGLTSINFESLSLGIRIFMGFTFFACLAFLARWALPSFRKLVVLETVPRLNENVMLNYFSICYLSSFFLSTNYDYRLVFLMPALIIFDRDLFAKKVSSNERKFFMVLALSSLYIGSVYGAPHFFLQAFQFVGDVGLSLISTILLVRLLSNFYVVRLQRWS